MSGSGQHGDEEDNGTRIFVSGKVTTTLAQGIHKFANQQTSGGMVLIIATVLALVLANGPMHDAYEHFFHTKVDLTIGQTHLFEVEDSHVAEDEAHDDATPGDDEAADHAGDDADTEAVSPLGGDAAGHGGTPAADTHAADAQAADADAGGTVGHLAESFEAGFTLHHLINDGLMAIFFFVVGLEVKREILVGELSSPRQAALPIAGAIGGMLFPAGLFVLINLGTPGLKGWGVPMATDIAFALGILSMVGRGLPTALKVFLAALAIADDIGGVLVIAFFYTESIAWSYLGVAAVVFAALWALNFWGARSAVPYALLGLVMWYCFLHSGVHATIAGILVAFTIPARPRIRKTEFLATMQDLLNDFRNVDVSGSSTLANHQQQILLAELEGATQEVSTPLSRLEHGLHPWIAFAVLPIFALANAGVPIDGEAIGHVTERVSMGIVVGLVVGKPVGILLMSWLAVKMRLADLSEGVNWSQMLGVACLGGIGFTMSLFIATLAFGSSEPGGGGVIDTAKVGILLASLLSGVLGAVILKTLGKADPNAPVEAAHGH